jgi:hypothetical protein
MTSLFLSLILLFSCFAEEEELHPEEMIAEDLNSLYDAHQTFHRSLNTGAPFHLQLEAKVYSTPGILLENDDIIISGV